MQTALYRLDESERKIEELQADNNILKTKVAEIKKSWETFQTIASDASKIQQLIVAFKRIKKELLESRRCCDLNTNIIDDLKRENTRLLRKLEDSSSDCKFDINEIREHVATLKRELSSITIKAEQQEVLIKNLKTREEKLVASIKRNM